MNRTIPYGYTIRNGCISVDKDAASTIGAFTSDTLTENHLLPLQKS